MGRPSSASEIGYGMTDQRWREIPGYSRYEVSDRGEVRSWIPWRGTPLPRAVRPSRDSGGYPQVSLWGDAGRQSFGVHRLVMRAFVGRRPEGKEIRHLDGNPLNCSLSNLQYGTRSENQYDRVRHGTHHAARKTHCKHGHPLSGENLYVDVRGMRQCRTCGRASARRWQQKRRSAVEPPPLHQPRPDGLGGILVTRIAAAHFVGRSPDTIRHACEPIACDVKTQARLYDFDAVAGRFARRAA